MYLKLLAALTFSFLSLTYLVMANTVPQTIAWEQKSIEPILMHAECPSVDLTAFSHKRHI
ncbi:hypothetical protein [Sneathiella limimaris]|uniref:hypothetical protein n=1 Tax=Sneathiella limimaris TaxID=1964213 RepID=UPI001469B8A3|nr:hypothetical protein [Sneathiella limimaris]